MTLVVLLYLLIMLGFSAIANLSQSPKYRSFFKRCLGLGVAIIITIFIVDEVDVALQRTVYTVTEGDSAIEICAVVNTSTIAFDFNISIALKSNSDDENLFQGLCSAILKAHNFIQSILFHRYIFQIRHPVIFSI